MFIIIIIITIIIIIVCVSGDLFTARVSIGTFTPLNTLWTLNFIN